MTSRISGELDQSKSLDLNIYEIRVDQPFLENKSTIETFLYECQCALLLVDITNKDSFQLIQELLKAINVSKFPYLKLILVLNKLDLESTRQVTSYEVNEYLENNKNLDNQEISLKSGDNLKELLKKINAAVNETKNELPINIVSEALDKKINLINGQGALSFILIGDSTVGKTCFLTRYFKNQFNETFLSTIGIDKEIKHIKVGNDCYKITLWDTAGQDRFRAITKNYYKGSHGIILIYDVTSLKTFENVKSWVSQIHEEISDKVVIYLVANKIDMDDLRKVTKEEGKKLAEELDVPFVETSAKTGENIDYIFSDISERIDKVFGNIQRVAHNKTYKAPGKKCC